MGSEVHELTFAADTSTFIVFYATTHYLQVMFTTTHDTTPQHDTTIWMAPVYNNLLFFVMQESISVFGSLVSCCIFVYLSIEGA